MNYDNLSEFVWTFVHPDYLLDYRDKDLIDKLKDVELQYQAQKSLILGEIERRKKK